MGPLLALIQVEQLFHLILWSLRYAREVQKSWIENPEIRKKEKERKKKKGKEKKNHRLKTPASAYKWFGRRLSVGAYVPLFNCSKKKKIKMTNKKKKKKNE